MADPRKKIPTKPITMRFPMDVADALIKMSYETRTAQVQIINKLVRKEYARFNK